MRNPEQGHSSAEQLGLPNPGARRDSEPHKAALAVNREGLSSTGPAPAPPWRGPAAGSLGVLWPSAGSRTSYRQRSPDASWGRAFAESWVSEVTQSINPIPKWQMYLRIGGEKHCYRRRFQNTRARPRPSRVRLQSERVACGPRPALVCRGTRRPAPSSPAPTARDGPARSWLSRGPRTD